jgi:hypothetical protein
MRKLTSLLLLFSLTLTVFLSACSPPLPAVTLPPVSLGAWHHSDLRWIGFGDAADPQQDLIAVYARSTGQDLQVRLDILEFRPDFPFDIYLALDLTAGGENDLPVSGSSDLAWDELFIFNSTTAPLQLLPGIRPQETTAASLSIEQDFDGLVLHLDARYLIPGIRFQIFITPPGSTDRIDSTPQIELNGLPPAPAPLLLAFWDTLPAASPAQVLRRWNGAHTGPLGQRHGLYQLLKSSDTYNLPLALLDLKSPASLAAIATMQQMEWLVDLDQRRLLILPDAAFGDPQAASYSLAQSRSAGEQYGLSPSPFLFASTGTILPDGYQAAFYASTSSRLLPVSQARLIPLPGPVYPEEGGTYPSIEQVDRSGLTLDARRSLLETALSGDPARISVMGGSLPDSAWADSSITSLAFAYIASHPWIDVLNAEDLLLKPLPAGSDEPPLCPDLLCLPAVLPFIPYTSAEQPISSGLSLPEMRQLIYSDLISAPPGSAADLAWDMYLQLTIPTTNPFRQALQANYLGQAGHLLYIARWEANPVPVSDCTVDLDWDGEPDCVLASSNFIATFKTDGSRLLFAGSIDQGKFQQWIGPTSQFRIGAGEPSEWAVRRGPASDPNEIPGAFAPLNGSYPAAVPAVGPNYITFRAPDGAQRIYRLEQDGFRLTYQGGPFQTQLPITFSAVEVSDAAAAGQDPEENSINQLQVQLAGASFKVNSTADSLEWMPQSENPDRSYSPGHFLPYPLTVLEIQSDGDISILVQRK